MAKTKNAISTKTLSPVGRGSFVFLLKPHKWEDDGPKKRSSDDDDDNDGAKYSIVLVFDRKAQKTEEFKRLVKTVTSVAQQQFGKEAISKTAEDATEALRSKYHNPIRPGSDYKKHGEPFTDKGAVFVKFASYDKPGIIDDDDNELDSKKEVYAGAYYRVSYVARAFSTRGNDGVHMLLNNVQKKKDGEPLTQMSDPHKDFGDDDDDDDDAEDLL